MSTSQTEQVGVKTVTHFRKPERSFWQIWNMSFGFLGIQFGWGLQMANMSAIYEYLGARADQIPLLWLAAPLTGLFVQPVIGHMSDRTWGRLGRRRPYFLVGALLSSSALVLMPNARVPARGPRGLPQPAADGDARRGRGDQGRHRPHARHHAAPGLGPGLHLGGPVLHVALLPGGGGAQRVPRPRRVVPPLPRRR